MEIRNKNQNLYVLKASTIGHSDIQDLPVGICKHRGYIKFSFCCGFLASGDFADGMECGFGRMIGVGGGAG